MRRGIYALGVLLVFVSCLHAAEDDEKKIYREALRRTNYLAEEIEAAIYELEHPAAASPYPASLLSTGANATVRIGGEIRANYYYSSSKLVTPHAGVKDPFTSGKTNGNYRGGDLSVTRTRLSLDMTMGDRWRAGVALNLEGHGNLHQTSRQENEGSTYREVEEREFVESAYVELLKAGHSGFGAKVGQFRLPFGLRRRPALSVQSFMESPDLYGSFLMGTLGRKGMARLPHASALLDPAVAAMISYELRDIIRFEASVFQERDGNGILEFHDAARAKYRSESSLPQSFQLGLTLEPLDGWELSMDFRNRYNRGRGVRYWANDPYRTDFAGNLASGAHDPVWDGVKGEWADAGNGPGFGSVRNEQAFVVGVAVDLFDSLSARVEYVHGWNQGFNSHIRSDGVNLGLSYRLNPFVTLHGQGEWLGVRDESWLVSDGAGGFVRDHRNNHLYRLLFGVEYEPLHGLVLEAGWQYEYWLFKSAAAANGDYSRSLIANTWYMGTRFAF